MKKLFAIFSILLFAFTLCGAMLIFKFQQMGIHNEMERTIAASKKSSEINILKLSYQEFQANKTSENEIRLNGKMYDIAKIEFENNFVIVHCINDTKEENLFASLAKFFSSPKNSTQQQDNSLPQQFVKFLSLNFLQVEHSFANSLDFSETNFQHFQSSHSQVFLSSDFPPPKI